MRFFTGIVCLSLSGCAHGLVSETPQVLVPGDLALGYGDAIDIKVFGESELSGPFRLEDDGTIEYPLLGQVKLEGLEARAAGRYLASRLAEKYVKNPQVILTVKEQPSKRVLIFGQVGRPGIFPFTPHLSVIEAISLAGGFTQLAAKNHTTITRTEQGQKTLVEVPVAEISEGRAKNVQLRPGDIINVPERLF